MSNLKNYLFMKKFVFTQEHLEDYYENRFQDNLKHFFDIKNEDGIDVVHDINRNSYSVFPSRPAAALAAQLPIVNTTENNCKIRGEEEILFVNLCLYMFEIEDKLARIADNAGSKKLASCMKDFGLPSLFSVDINALLNSFIGKTLRYTIYIKNEVDALIEANSLVGPFIMDKFVPFLKEWDNASISENNIFMGTFGSTVKERVIDDLHYLYRKFYVYKGLTGVDFSFKNIADYYRTSFFTQLEDYFLRSLNIMNFVEIFGVDNRSNTRWEDGNPGGNVSENMMFASMMIYMVMAEQSILEYAKESISDYHRSSGWPKISSDSRHASEAGCRLHPLLMLGKAGLFPLKHEMQLFMEFVKNVFPFLRQEMHCILNGTNQMKNEEAGQRFLEVIKKKRVKSRIKRYIEKEEKCILDLLNKWAESSCNSWDDFLQSEGVEIQET